LTHPDRPLPPRHLYNESYVSFPGSEAAGVCRLSPSPFYHRC